jgi:hypothetical protein
MRPKPQLQFASFGREIAVYTLLVAGYLYLVLRYLAEWLHQLFLHQRVTYAIVALAAVVVQGFILEQLTHWLLHFLKRGKRPLE